MTLLFRRKLHMHIKSINFRYALYKHPFSCQENRWYHTTSRDQFGMRITSMDQHILSALYISYQRELNIGARQVVNIGAQPRSMLVISLCCMIPYIFNIDHTQHRCICGLYLNKGLAPEHTTSVHKILSLQSSHTLC